MMKKHYTDLEQFQLNLMPILQLHYHLQQFGFHQF